MTKNFQAVKAATPAEPADAFLLEPWFRSREEAVAILRAQSLGERRKFADFFALNGCLRCGTRNKRHGGQGFCPTCRDWFIGRLQQAMRARERGEI